MWTDRRFWLDATWRAFRSFCQSLAALLAGQTLTLLSAPWASMLSIAATAALVSLLMSVDRGRAVTAAEPPAAPAPVARSTPGVYITEANPAAADFQPAANVAAGPGCGGDMR